MKRTFVIFIVLTLVFTFTTTAFARGLNGDFDNDGDVDSKDLSVFSQNFGKVDGTCTDSDNCIPGYYCEKNLGDCNGVGVCTQKPTACFEIYDPVCGCDGETYVNLCYAAAAGVNVMHKGRCPIPGEFKLGQIFALDYQEKKINSNENIGIKFESVLYDSRCAIDVHCFWEGNAEVEFTFLKNNVKKSFVLNTGIEPTSISLFGYEIRLVRLEPPVLSNNPPDHEDYIAYLVITRSPVSCFDNTDCRNDLYCAKVPADCDGSGECAPRPSVCPDIWDPVCGCDGNTYGNKCEAAMAGVNVNFEGECRDTRCDDGSTVICLMIPPVCSEHEILAVQKSCWICVNPATCRPWGEPGCKIETGGVDDCPENFYCDPCGTSSCPFCDDCVPACVPE